MADLTPRRTKLWQVVINALFVLVGGAWVVAITLHVLGTPPACP